MGGPSPRAQAGTARARIAIYFHFIGVDGTLRERFAQGNASTGTDKLFRRTDAGRTPIAKSMLDQPVFAGVVTDDGEYATRRETITQTRQGALESHEFIVDGNAHRLKNARKVWRSTARSQHGADRIDEVVGGRERASFASSHDLAGQPRRPWFVSIRPQECRQVDLIDGVEQFVGAETGVGAHAHVERCPFAKGKAAREVVELMRRDAQVEQDAVKQFGVREPRFLEVGVVPQERSKPAVINGSRRERIARGAGVEVYDVNQLLKQFAETRKMMKQFQSASGKGKKRMRFPGMPM